jgi:DNA-binding MarR family transcriptional regulator
MNDLAGHLTIQLERLMQGLMLSRVAEIDQGLEMTPAEVHTVRMLSPGPLTMSSLAEALGVPLSTATHRVDKLVKRKLVVRGRSKIDRRVVEVSLSAKGRTLDERMHDVHRQTSEAMLAPLSAGERQVLIELITKINEAQ